MVFDICVLIDGVEGVRSKASYTFEKVYKESEEQIEELRMNLNSSRQQGLSTIYNTPFQV